MSVSSLHRDSLITVNSCCRSSYPRRATVLNYFADGVCSDSDQPLLSGIPVIAPGCRMEGQFFPLVYDPAWTIIGASVSEPTLVV